MRFIIAVYDERGQEYWNEGLRKYVGSKASATTYANKDNAEIVAQGLRNLLWNDKASITVIES